MTEPAIPGVPMELWREVLEGALAFRKAEPWSWMNDDDACVVLDPDGAPWFACVLGAAEQVFGLCLYRGEGGLRLLRGMIRATGLPDPARWQHAQDAITLWFGPKRDLDEAQVARYAKLGYKGRKGDRLAWPDVRSHRPGYFPWHPDEAEVRVLARALPAVLEFAAAFRRRSRVYEAYGPDDLPVLPREGPVNWQTIEWRTWLTPGEPAVGPAVKVDEGSEGFRGLVRLPVNEESDLACDVRYLPEPVSDGERPYFPRGVVVMRSSDAFCCGMDLMKPDEDDAVKASEALGNAMGRMGARPRRIVFQRFDLIKRLLPWAQALNISLGQEPRLPAVEHFWAMLEEHHRQERI